MRTLSQVKIIDRSLFLPVAILALAGSGPWPNSDAFPRPGAKNIALKPAVKDKQELDAGPHPRRPARSAGHLGCGQPYAFGASQGARHQGILHARGSGCLRKGPDQGEQSRPSRRRRESGRRARLQRRLVRPRQQAGTQSADLTRHRSPGRQISAVHAGSAEALRRGEGVPRQEPGGWTGEPPLFDRCIMFSQNGPPIIPGNYNNLYEIVQTPASVTIFSEMAHQARTVPLDTHERLPQNVTQWMGDSWGHFEGNTLVVETTNVRYNDMSHFGTQYDYGMTGSESESRGALHAHGAGSADLSGHGHRSDGLHQAMDDRDPHGQGRRSDFRIRLP